jgi:hypothetical protein
MSDDRDEGFLGRWSRLKRQAEPPDPEAGKPPRSDEPMPEANAEPGLPAPGLPDLDLELPELPSLESITATTDMTVFMHPAVPEHVRGAALRRLWSVDPAIRDFVSPALDYAYDWNTPGGAPGYGPLGKGDDVLRMLGEIVDGYARAIVPEDGEPKPAPDVPAIVSEAAAEPPPGTETVSAVEEEPPVPETTTSAVLRAEAPEDTAPARRRHGGALPA